MRIFVISAQLCISGAAFVIIFAQLRNNSLSNLVSWKSFWKMFLDNPGLIDIHILPFAKHRSIETLLREYVLLMTVCETEKQKREN